MEQMSKKARLIEKERMQKAKAFEHAAELPQAIKTYGAVLGKNPVHIQAASRLLVLLRKTKDAHAEVKLLKDLITNRQARLETIQKNWVDAHKQLARDSAPLAKILGLLGSKELPISQDETLEKWKARLISLEKRITIKKEKAAKKRK